MQGLKHFGFFFGGFGLRESGETKQMVQLFWGNLLSWGDGGIREEGSNGPGRLGEEGLDIQRFFRRGAICAG
jgi:hypothetical protein